MHILLSIQILLYHQCNFAIPQIFSVLRHWAGDRTNSFSEKRKSLKTILPSLIAKIMQTIFAVNLLSGLSIIAKCHVKTNSSTVTASALMPQNQDPDPRAKNMFQIATQKSNAGSSSLIKALPLQQANSRASLYIRMVQKQSSICKLHVSYFDDTSPLVHDIMH